MRAWRWFGGHGGGRPGGGLRRDGPRGWGAAALRASIWAASGAEIVQNRILTYVSNVVAWSKCETPGLQGRCRGAAHAHGPGLGCGSGGAGGPNIYEINVARGVCTVRRVHYVNYPIMYPTMP